MADDYDVLFPGQRVTLSTEEAVEVREFSIRDGLAVNAFAYPLIADLEALFAGDKVDDVAPHLIDQTLGRHTDIVMRALSVATGKPVAWLDALDDADGQVLVHALWVVNTGFFIRRLVQMRQARTFDSARPLQS